MRAVVGGRWSVVRIVSLALVLATSCITACSIPNLEATECTESRDVVREFYSFHFDNNLGATDQDIVARQKYLTPAFFESRRELLLHGYPPETDPFTGTQDRPKAFRIGECKVVQPGKETEFQVLLFWKYDKQSEQRPIAVGVENQDGKWLIKSVAIISFAIH